MSVNQLFFFFYGFIGPRVALVFSLALVAALLEGFGIAVVIPVVEMQFGTSDADIATKPNWISGLIFSLLSSLSIKPTTGNLIWVVLAAFIVKGVVVFSALWYSGKLRATLLLEIRKRVYVVGTRQANQCVDGNELGQSVNMVNEQPVRAADAFTFLANLSTAVIAAFVYLSVSIAVSPGFGLGGMIFGASVLLIYRRLNRKLSSLSHELAYETGVLSSLVMQTFNSLPYLIATNQQLNFDRLVLKSFRSLSFLSRSIATLKAFIQSSREPLIAVMLLAVVYANITLFGADAVGIMASAILLYRAANATLNIQSDYSNLMALSGSVALLNAELARQGCMVRAYGEEEKSRLPPSIELRNVSVSFAEQTNVPALDRINLTIEAFTSVAIVGASGSGKSTLLRLIARTITPTNGEVYLGGLPESELSEATWRRQLGYVTQDPLIFNGTIAENIHLWGVAAEPDANAQSNMEKAARRAFLDERINALKDKYNTKIGEAELQLSGGEKQRLFLARELYRAPSIILLDEATSALDDETERRVRSTIDELRGFVTVIAIAHRMSSVRNFDRAIVLERGRIIEDGPIPELMKTPGAVFRKLMEGGNG